MSYDQTHVPWSSQMIGIDHPYLAASISACSATRSNPGAMTYDLPCGPWSQYEPNLFEPSLLCLGTVTKKTYPLVMTNIAIENGPVKIVSFPINSMVDLSIVCCMFTRV